MEALQEISAIRNTVCVRGTSDQGQITVILQLSATPAEVYRTMSF